jgi:hypothetical protein
MLDLVKGTVVVQLAAQHQLPEHMQARVQDLARARTPNQIIHYLQDQCISRNTDRADVQRIRRALEAMNAVSKDVANPEDMGTLIANFETHTGKPFTKPAWMTAEMMRVQA